MRGSKILIGGFENQWSVIRVVTREDQGGGKWLMGDEIGAYEKAIMLIYKPSSQR